MDQMNNDQPEDQVMQRFDVSLLTEGSGTQIFSTSFAQWAAREALRRAQPLTLSGTICSAATAEANE